MIEDTYDLLSFMLSMLEYAFYSVALILLLFRIWCGWNRGLPFLKGKTMCRMDLVICLLLLNHYHYYYYYYIFIIIMIIIIVIILAIYIYTYNHLLVLLYYYLFFKVWLEHDRRKTPSKLTIEDNGTSVVYFLGPLLSSQLKKLMSNTCWPNMSLQSYTHLGECYNKSTNVPKMRMAGVPSTQ